MGTEPTPSPATPPTTSSGRLVWWGLTAFAAMVGMALIIDAACASSATYDETAYLRIAARWWRTGDQFEITRMGSPLSFWKLQQSPVLWVLDRLGRSDWVDDPCAHEREILPWMRIGSSWIWLCALALSAGWSRQLYGPRAMALAAWLFALSPNLIAHGALVTMELPLLACTTAMFWLFWQFLDSNRRAWFWAAAGVGGLAFSCKFTTVILPPILASVWWVAQWRGGERHAIRLTRRVAVSMVGFAAVMLLSNMLVTGLAFMPLSPTRGHHPTLQKWLGPDGSALAVRAYETPLPQDWVGFATQLHHQASGGPSYLWGERRMKGWWYYYFVALAVKVPLVFWLLVAVRLAAGRPNVGDPTATSRGLSPSLQCGGGSTLPLVFVLYLAITAAGSSRNYGVRYLLPLAPLAIVWVSGLAAARASTWKRLALAAGVAGYGFAVWSIRPYELTYFNELAGGPRGGRHILADSNLDWGQGLKSLARLERERPELCDLTLYYFGDTEPAHYGVVGRSYVVNAVDDQSRLPSLANVDTAYVAVSASLQWGPWGPAGFFSALDRLTPVAYTADTTIAIYRAADVRRALAARN
jgi:Dolichyl-phosphate-mannose-protein mannosyltransferase